MTPHRDASRPLPNIRGEEESELEYLIHVIECTSRSRPPFSLHQTPTPSPSPPIKPPPLTPAALSYLSSSSPTKHPTVLLGRHPKTSAPSASYVAAVYSVAKSGAKTLEIGPEMGSSRKEALKRLLEVVEGEVGRGILRDGRRKGEGEGREREGMDMERKRDGVRREGVGGEK